MDRTLLHELIDAAARDVLTYKNPNNPNSHAAGEAALRSIDAVARAVQEVRATLAGELYPIDRPETYVSRYAPGNSGPGF
jgi:hypothetical protein